MPAAAAENSQAAPIYVNIFFHLESSPIRGVRGNRYSGQGPTAGSRTVHAALDLFEQFNLRAELAMTGIFARQLAEDYPATFERGMKEFQQLNGVILRHKVPDWAMDNAWNYKP